MHSPWERRILVSTLSAVVLFVSVDIYENGAGYMGQSIEKECCCLEQLLSTNYLRYDIFEDGRRCIIL